MTVRVSSLAGFEGSFCFGCFPTLTPLARAATDLEQQFCLEGGVDAGNFS